KTSAKESGHFWKNESRSIKVASERPGRGQRFKKNRERNEMSGNAAEALTKPAFRKIDWMARDIDVERRADGVVVLQALMPLNPDEHHNPASPAKWAAERPDRTWLAQRGPDKQWRKLSYAEAKRSVDGLTQGILNLKLRPDGPVAILSGNSIEHALM